MSSTIGVTPFLSSIGWFSGRPILSAKCSLKIDVPEVEQKLVDKIRERISNGKVEMSPSAYDTAWVAMVPSQEYSGGIGIGRPSFPQCLDWIMENQNPDGSWGLSSGHPYLLKDSLSCTLACLLALRKWNTGNHLVLRGMDFIESNGWAATHDNQFPPIGFDIVFPAMINYAKELDLTLPIPPTLLHSLLHIRDSSEIRQQNWESVAEGVIYDSCNWKRIIGTHQRRNGSLFDSPATTAAAVIHCGDDKCFHYLTSILKHSNGWVPTFYPMDIYARLCMIDTLQRLGIDRYFGAELSSIFDELYRNWQEREEEIFSNVTCLALAFRLLKMKGFDVSSDELAEFVEQEGFFNNVGMQHMSSEGTVLELYRASETRIHEEESNLDRINAWTKSFLKQQLLNKSIRDKRLQKQVEYELMKNFHGILNRFQNRQSIDLYDPRFYQIAKTAYRFGSVVYNEDLLQLSIQDFKISREEYVKELEQINKWYSDCGLDQLSDGRNACRLSYIITAAVIVDPHLSMARITYAQVIILITNFDDFFDRYGSKQEAFSLIHLIREWKPADSYCSKDVEILFNALYDTINGVAAKAHADHGFCSKQQLIHLWVELVEGAVREKETLSGNKVSSLEEYLTFSTATSGCKTCVMTSIHFLGVQLSEEIWSSEELNSLNYHGDIICRLLNDLQTYKREKEENTINSVSLQQTAGGGGVSEEEAVAKVKEVTEYHRRKVMQLVVRRRRQGSSVPRECLELVSKTCKLAYCLYGDDVAGDEFSLPRNILEDINAMMFQPLP